MVPGFEPFKHELSPITTRPGLPTLNHCGTIGRVVVSDTTDLRFKSRHYQQILHTVNYFEKTKMKKKEAGKWPNFEKLLPIAKVKISGQVVIGGEVASSNPGNGD